MRDINIQQLNSFRQQKKITVEGVSTVCGFHIPFETPALYSTRRELSFISIKLPCVSTSLHHSTHKGINLIQIRVRWIETDRDQQSVGGR